MCTTRKSERSNPTANAASDRETVTDSIAAVVTRDPDWTQLPPGVPAGAVALLRRCVERDPRKRLRDIGEARIALEDPSLLAVPATVHHPSPSGRRGTLAAAAILVGVIAVAMTIAAMQRPGGDEGALPALHFTITPPAGSGPLMTSRLSPDGTRVAMATGAGVWVRRLDSTEARLVYSHPSVRQVFWSPDSETVGIATASELLKVPSAGGAAERIASIASVPGPFNPVGGDASWLDDGRIVFLTGMSAVMEVPAAGGDLKEIVPVSSISEDFHGASVLPSGGVVTVVHEGQDVSTIALLRDGQRSIVYQARDRSVGMPVYSATGHLLFVLTGRTDGGLWALRFDERRGTASGEPFRLPDPGDRLDAGLRRQCRRHEVPGRASGSAGSARGDPHSAELVQALQVPVGVDNTHRHAPRRGGAQLGSRRAPPRRLASGTARSSSATAAEPIDAGSLDVDIMMLDFYHHDVRTTLTLDDDVAAKLKAESRRSGRAFRDVVNDALRRGLMSARPAKRASFRVQVRSLGGRRPGLHTDSVADLLEQIEGPLHK